MVKSLLLLTLKMKTLFIALLVCQVNVFAQAQVQFVTSTGGDFFSSASGSLEWTLGEPVTETFQKDNTFLTQGFHQTFKQESGTTGILVYPNPTRDFLFVRTPSPGNYQIELFNLHGVKLMSGRDPSSADNLYQLDVQALEAAVYLLRVKNISSGRLFTFKIILL
jgi:hypothetical protein